MMRAVPRIPESRMTTQSHHTGLKRNSSAKAMSAPATPPMAAVWVEIFHQMLMSRLTAWMSRAAMTMMMMKW